MSCWAQGYSFHFVYMCQPTCAKSKAWSHTNVEGTGIRSFTPVRHNPQSLADFCWLIAVL